MKPDLLNHTFHGKIEPVRNTDLTLPTAALEGIEVAVFIAVIYFIFVRFWMTKVKTDVIEPVRGGALPGLATQRKKL